MNPLPHIEEKLGDNYMLSIPSDVAINILRASIMKDEIGKPMNQQQVLSAREEVKRLEAKNLQWYDVGESDRLHVLKTRLKYYPSTDGM